MCEATICYLEEIKCGDRYFLNMQDRNIPNNVYDECIATKVNHLFVITRVDQNPSLFCVYVVAEQKDADINTLTNLSNNHNYIKRNLNGFPVEMQP